MTKLIVLLGIFLDILGISIMIPAYPELVTFYGVSERQISISLTVYALCAFLAAPLLGQRSDKIGRKTPLLLCITGTLLSFGVLLVTQSYLLFLLSRLINGITGGNISILQAIMTDISSDNLDRKKNLGLLGMLFGLAFIVGPLLGAFLVKRHIHAVFATGAILAAGELVLIILRYTETNRDLKPHVQLKRNPFAVFKKYFTGHHARYLLRSLSLVMIATFSYQSVVTFYMSSTFGMPGYQIGRYLALIGLLAAINQGVLLPKVRLPYFSTMSLIKLIHGVGIVMFSLLAIITKQFRLFVIARSLTSVIMGIGNPVYQSEIIERTDKKSVGEINGLLGSMGSLAMFTGPLIGSLSLGFDISIFRPSLLLVGISAVVMIGHYLKGDHLSSSSV